MDDSRTQKRRDATRCATEAALAGWLSRIPDHVPDPFTGGDPVANGHLHVLAPTLAQSDPALVSRLIGGAS